MGEDRELDAIQEPPASRMPTWAEELDRREQRWSWLEDVNYNGTLLLTGEEVTRLLHRARYSAWRDRQHLSDSSDLQAHSGAHGEVD